MKTVICTVYEYSELSDEARKRVLLWLGRELRDDEVSLFMFHEDGAIANIDNEGFHTLHIDLNELDLPNSFIIPMDTIRDTVNLLKNAEYSLDGIEVLMGYHLNVDKVCDILDTFIDECVSLGNRLQREQFADLARRKPPLVVVDKRKEADRLDSLL